MSGPWIQRMLAVGVLVTLATGCGKCGNSNASPSGTETPTPVAIPTAVITPTTGTPSPATPAAATPTATATPVSLCGNGVLDGSELCDGTVFDTSLCVASVCTCEDFCDAAGGTLSCNPDCTLNFTRCTAPGCEL